VGRRVLTLTLLEERGSEANGLSRVGLVDEQEPPRELGEDGPRRHDLLYLLNFLVERGLLLVKCAHSIATTRRRGIKGDAPKERDGQLADP